VELNQEFLIETFFSYCKRPLFKKYQNVFNAECPVCKEGKSSGRSRRLFYFPLKNYIYCHNCSQSWKPFEWVKEVTSLTVPEIIRKNNEKIQTGINIAAVKSPQPLEPLVAVIQEDLPEESIDITDPRQVEFYTSNKFVQLATAYCRDRRLMTAVNTCGKFYISLKDRVHKHRLIIPFFNNGKVSCYQSRSLSKEQFPKYLTKLGEKEVFGLDNVKADIPYVFVFEGPIDSMFVQNGLAIAALSATDHQRSQLNNLIGYELIYVFDNDKNNSQTSNKIQKHIKEGKRTFIWPREFWEFKDFNEICCKLNLNEIPWKFVVKHSFKNAEALIKFKLNLGTFGNSK